MEARQVEVAAAESVEALRQSQATTEQVGQDNRARFRELLEQNGGTVTPEMKALRAEYLEQQKTATELAGLITQREKQLPGLADVTGQKAHAYITCHERIMDERIDALIDEFFLFHAIELTSLLRMKYSQFERDGSPHAPGVLEGANDADTLYRGYIMNLMLSWTNKKLPLMSLMMLSALQARTPSRLPELTGVSVNGSPARSKNPLSPAPAGLFYVCCASACLCCMKTHESQASRHGSKGQQRRGAKPFMQVHENRYMKCAGVAGLRARAMG